MMKHVDEETYDNVVNHFIYLGGINSTDSAGHYFKCAFADNEKISPSITWLGTNEKHSLKETRFAEACEDAMAENLNYQKPGRKEFEDAMCRALKSMKERRRKHLAAVNTDVNRRRGRDLSNDVDEDAQPIRKRRLENVNPRDLRGCSESVADHEGTDLVIEADQSSDIDEQHLFKEEITYQSNKDYLEENIEKAGQQDDTDYTLTASDCLTRIEEFDRQRFSILLKSLIQQWESNNVNNNEEKQ